MWSSVNGSLRAFTATTIAIGIVAVLAAAPNRTGAQTLETIRMTAVATDDMTPVFYALKTGQYQKAGIDLQIVPASNGAAAQNAVLSGAYELGKSSTYSLVLAYTHGLPVSIVAPGAVWDPKIPFVALIVPSDSPVKTAADLNGKTIATNGLNDISALAVNLWMDHNGGDSKSLKYVEIPNSAAGEALIQHRVDATVLLDPQLHATLDTGKARILALVYSAISDHFLMGAYFANKDWAAKHSDAVRKFAAVTAEAAKYTNAHQAETAPMMAETTKIPLPVFQKFLRVTAATGDPAALLQPLVDAAAKYKYIPNDFAAKTLFVQ